MNKILKRQSGYTIVELIVAIAVAGILTLTITLLITSTTHISQSARDLVVATSFAENIIEEKRSAGYLSLSNGTYTIPISQLPTELKGPPSGQYVIETYAPSIKKITVSITYNDQGTTRTRSYATLIGELGVGQY